jgi:hypothetical protein
MVTGWDISDMEEVNSSARGVGLKTAPAVEKARRGVESMEVEEETSSKASMGSIRDRMMEAARTAGAR